MAKGVERLGVVSDAGTDVGETGLDKQYLHSKSAASIASSTVLVFRTFKSLSHVGRWVVSFQPCCENFSQTIRRVI